jgi:hypothetical protein
MHTLGEQHSLFLVELFTSVHWRLRLIPVPGRTRLETLEEPERAYSNALVAQGELRVVYYRYQSRPVILVVINKRSKALVKILVL